MNLSPATLRKRLIDLAALPYHASGRFAWRFARGKLGGDPMFLAVLERGLIPDQARLLDLGCGQGLLYSWLRSARELYDQGEWTANWPAPPRVASFHGVELMSKDVERARDALGDSQNSGGPNIECNDMCRADYGQVDVVVIMDVLHYVDYPAQDDVLTRVRAALPAGGLLLTRVGDASAGLGFHLSNWVDRIVAAVRGHSVPPLYCRSLADWLAALEKHGFSIETDAMNGALPFANTMLVAKLSGRAG
jgi:SAM-dependent methyltransferase